MWYVSDDALTCLVFHDFQMNQLKSYYRLSKNLLKNMGMQKSEYLIEILKQY